MKKICAYVVLFMLLPFALLGQNNNTLRYSYTKNLEAYVGTWEYKSPTELFRIKFISGSRYTMVSYSGCVNGGYLYQKNGVTVADYISLGIRSVWDDRIQKDGDIKIMGTNALYSKDYVDPNELRIYFYDNVNKKHTFSGRFQLIGSGGSARWTLENDEEGSIDVSQVKPEGFSVPTNVVLTKVAEVPPPPPPPSEPGTPPALPGFDPNSARQTAPDSLPVR